MRNDAAYVKGPKARYVIAICARRIQDKSAGVDNEALRTGAELSRMVYDDFARKQLHGRAKRGTPDRRLDARNTAMKR